MRCNSFWTTVSKTLAAVAVMLIVVLTLASGAMAASKYKVLYTFNGGKGGSEYTNLGPFIEYFSSSLILDNDGNLYGATPAGGIYGHGVVFRLSPTAKGPWKERVLYNFRGSKDGGEPMTNLFLDSAGSLYGTTFKGGKLGLGTVFELTPIVGGAWKETVIHSFSGGDDGTYPMLGLIADNNGNLYGATDGGGAYGDGIIFYLTPNGDGTWTENTLHTFSGDDGSPQLGGLAFDASGNLYGTGQGPGSGSVFRLSPNADGTWTETLLHQFTGGDGWDPFSFSGLVFDNTGNIYGTAFWNHGTAAGVVFKLSPNQDGSWSESDVYSFTGGADGEHPEAGVIFDSAGNLYGTTPFGGDYNCYHGPYSDGCGVVFRLSPNPDSTWKERVLHSFHDKPAAHPFAGVIRDAAGNLYGTTAGDGTTTFGTVFEITP